MDSGSITSGFGNINIGSSTLTTTGAAALGTITGTSTLALGSTGTAGTLSTPNAILYIGADSDSNASGDTIAFQTNGVSQVSITDGAIVPITDNDIDLGTSVLEFKDAFFDGTVTSDAFAGPLTGAVTGAVTGNASSATTATNVTAVANNSTDETVYPTFVDGTTGDQGIETDTGDRKSTRLNSSH